MLQKKVEELEKNAAKYIKNEIKKEGLMANTKPGNGIRYIVPQRIRPENVDKALDLFMRVDDVYSDMNMVISIDGREIKRMKKKHLAPGEMEAVKIKKDVLIASEYSVITVSLEKEGA